MIKLERTQQIADLIHGTIIYSGLEGAIISNPIFNRLHHISQGSLVSLTYASNNIKRFEHSVGVMHLAGEILYQSINNTTDSTVITQLISEAKEHVVKWFNSINFLMEKSLEHSYFDLYRENIFSIPYPACNLYSDKLVKFLNEEERFSYIVLYQSVRIAGLLHDVGHLPYSHIFEHTIKNLFLRVKNLENPNVAQTEFLEIIQDYCKNNELDDKKELHEELGIILIQQIKASVFEELSKRPSEKNLFVHAVFYFVEKILAANDNDNSFFSDIHKIIAGTLDADRLDYCCRDAFCSGVNTHIFPYQRLISNYKVILVKTARVPTDRKNLVFAPALKNILEVEDLLERRWNVFAHINFHHRVHKHEIIFAEILSQIGYDELCKCEDSIPNLEMGKPLPLSLMSIWALVKMLKTGNVLIDYLIIQLDDGWMDTLLKNAFFAKYGINYRSETKNINDPEWYKFNELISTKKHYLTLYKRSADFIDFDVQLGEKLLAYYESKEINHEYFQVAIEQIKNNVAKQKHSLLDVLNFWIIASPSILMGAEGEFIQNLEDELNAVFNTSEGKGIGIIDCIIRPSKIKTGFEEDSPILLWRENNTYLNFHAVSKEREIILSKKHTYIPFFVYYLPRNGEQANLEGLKTALIEAIIRLIEKYIE